MIFRFDKADGEVEFLMSHKFSIFPAERLCHI